jgi:hypothetical protein
MEFFDWLEHSAFSTAIKENWILYEMPLVAHAIGMAIMVGLSTVVYLRILGIAPSVPLGPLASYFKLMWTGFWMNAASGVLLVVLFPVKAVTNPVFYLKMSGVVLSVLFLRRIRRQAFGASLESGGGVSQAARTSAILGLTVWVVTITAGRLLAYDEIADVEPQTAIATLITTVALVLGYLGIRRTRASGVAG